MRSRSDFGEGRGVGEAQLVGCLPNTSLARALAPTEFPQSASSIDGHPAATAKPQLDKEQDRFISSTASRIPIAITLKGALLTAPRSAQLQHG